MRRARDVYPRADGVPVRSTLVRKAFRHVSPRAVQPAVILRDAFIEAEGASWFSTTV